MPTASLATSSIPASRRSTAVVARFGEDLLRPDGTLDRAALGRIVFADPAALTDLEAIVHPAVRPRILADLDAADRAGATAVVIEAIKLVEGGLSGLCDEVWLVTCDPDVQLERVVGRGSDPADAAARIGAQGDLVGRLRATATRVIDTSGPAGDVRSAVDGLMTEALAAGRP